MGKNMILSSNQLVIDGVDVFNFDAMQSAVNYTETIYQWIKMFDRDTDNILDFGAGHGAYANRFGRTIYCVEPEKDISSGINKQHNIFSNLDEIPEEIKFSFIYSINVLEHIENDTEMLRKLTLKLKPGGKFCLFVPACPELFTEMDKRVGHYRRYGKDELIEKVVAAGLIVVDYSFFDSLGYWASLVCKYKGKMMGWDGSYSPGNVRFYDKYLFPVSKLLDGISGKHFKGKNLMLEARLPFVQDIPETLEP